MRRMGLNADGSPNGCGVALSEPAVIEWQNQFNEAIIDAARALRLPPRLLKVVIAVESQFWPGSDWEKGEVGLGQMTEAGADMLLTWRPGVYHAHLFAGIRWRNLPGRLHST